MLSDTLEKMLEKSDSFFLKKSDMGVLVSAEFSMCKSFLSGLHWGIIRFLKDTEVSPLHPETVLLPQCF